VNATFLIGWPNYKPEIVPGLFFPGVVKMPQLKKPEDDLNYPTIFNPE
jgi:hypothetical protein